MAGSTRTPMTTADERALTDSPDQTVEQGVAPPLADLTLDSVTVPSTARRGRRRRRPSGAAPPLPRSLGATGKSWLIVLGVFVTWIVVVLSSHWAERVTERSDSAILRA